MGPKWIPDGETARVCFQSNFVQKRFRMKATDKLDKWFSCMGFKSKSLPLLFILNLAQN